jgi:hypothetical protein
MPKAYEIIKKGVTKMKAQIVGRKRSDFQGKEGPVKSMRFHVIVDTGECDEGHESGFVTWNEIEKGKAPDLKIGSEIEVSYNKYGRLQMAMAE